MAVLILSVAFGTSVATFLGGLAALRLRDHIHLILGFSAGTVVALAFLDLLPEALRLEENVRPQGTVIALAAAGFFAYALLDRLLLTQVSDVPGGTSPRRGWAGAGSLSVHSFVDGLALGMGFQASTAIGIVVTIAILAHDCSDGMNTVSIVLKHGGSRPAAIGWLIVDALTPLAGAAASLFYRPDRDGMALLLAAFAGFFLYIGASDLLPESFRAGAKLANSAAMLAGAATIYAAVRIVGG